MIYGKHSYLSLHCLLLIDMKMYRFVQDKALISVFRFCNSCTLLFYGPLIEILTPNYVLYECLIRCLRIVSVLSLKNLWWALVIIFKLGLLKKMFIYIYISLTNTMALCKLFVSYLRNACIDLKQIKSSHGISHKRGVLK